MSYIHSKTASGNYPRRFARHIRNMGPLDIKYTFFFVERFLSEPSNISDVGIRSILKLWINSMYVLPILSYYPIFKASALNEEGEEELTKDTDRRNNVPKAVGREAKIRRI
jgi:hypothetical protein